MIPEKATRLLMEFSVYNEVEEELSKQNKLIKGIPDDWSASMVVMHMSWASTSKGVIYWNRVHDRLERIERAEKSGDALPTL